MPDKSITPILGWDDVYILTTADGSDTLYSRTAQATYHSLFGAVGESKHVFIQNGLLTQSHRGSVSVLEYGMGTGLNAFLSYLFSHKNSIPVQYSGIEAFPIALSIASRLDYAGYLAFPDQQDVFLQMHSLSSFSADSFNFSKYTSLDQLPSNQAFDCIFFDAYAPADQPEAWEQSVFDQMHALTTMQGCLVTYCAQGEVRRKLTKAGYEVQRLPGPPGKREMLRGIKVQ